MLGHYTKLFHDIGAVKIRDAVPEEDYPQHLPVTNELAFTQANGTSYPWEYTVEERYENAPKGVIHIGAYDMPERGCYVPLFGENVIWVEANEKSFDRWTAPIATYFNHWAFNLAASDVNGTGRYYDNGSPEVSGLLPHVGKSPSYINVPQRRLDDIIDEYDINMNNFDFLNIDVEGAEHKVLRGLKKNIKYINYLFVEVAVSQRHDNQMIFDEMTKYVKELGFELNRVSDSIHTIGWGDAFYVRN